MLTINTVSSKFKSLNFIHRTFKLFSNISILRILCIFGSLLLEHGSGIVADLLFIYKVVNYFVCCPEMLENLAFYAP